MSAYSSVVVEVDGAVGTITLSRPDKLNAFTIEMVEELRDALTTLAGSAAVRVIVVPGADHFFHRRLHLIKRIILGSWQR